MAEGTGRKATQSEYEWQIRGFVLLSFILQVLLYFLPPLRNTTSSKWHLRLTSMVFYLSNWIPTFTLTFICSYAIHSSGDSGDYDPPLLTWATLMLLHLEGHGQERETPYSFQMSDLRKEFFRRLLKFVLHDVILFGMLYLFQWGKEVPSLYPPFLILAGVRTLSKLKHLSNQIKEMKELSKPIQLCYEPTVAQSDEGVITEIAHVLVQVPLKLFWLHRLSEEEQKACSNFFNKLTPIKAIRIIEVELNLIYNKFYGGVLPSMFELVVVFLLPAFKAYSITSFHAYISPVVHIVIITLLSTLFKPRFSLPMLLLSWYVHMYLKMTSIPPQVQYRSQGLEILVDGYIIDATALICTHLLVVHLWLMKQRCLSYQGNGRQHQSANVHKPLAGFNLLQYGLPTKVSDLMDNYLWQPLLDHGQDRLTKTHGWCRIVPRFNLLVYALRKPRKVCLLETLPVSSREQFYIENNIGEFILNELNMSYHGPKKLRNLISVKGLYVLEQYDRYKKLVRDIRAPFEDILLRWHLATGILYHVDNTTTSSSSSSSSSSLPNRDRSMLLSDYMGYLLMIHPRIMSKKRGDAFRKSQDALLEIIEQHQLSGIGGDHQSWTEETQLQKICSDMQSFYNTRRQSQTEYTKWEHDFESDLRSLYFLKSSVQFSVFSMEQMLQHQDSWSQQPPSPLPRPPSPPSKRNQTEYLDWKRQTEDHIREVVQSLSEIEPSLSKKSQILSLQESKDKQQPTSPVSRPPFPSKRNQKRQTEDYIKEAAQSRSEIEPSLSKKSQIISFQVSKDKQQPPSPVFRPPLPNDSYQKRRTQSLSEIEPSLRKKSQILSLQESKEEQQPPLPKEKDENDQTTSEKQPAQVLRKEDQIIQMEKLTEDVKKVVQLVLEILPILNIMLKTLTQNFREEQQKTPSKEKDEEYHQPKAKVLDVVSILHNIVKAIDPLSKIERSLGRMIRTMDLQMGMEMYRPVFPPMELLGINYIPKQAEFLSWVRQIRLSFDRFLSSLIEMKTYLERPGSLPSQPPSPRKDSSVDDAGDLAAEIKSTIPDTEIMWEIISKVWVGMLAYACIHSDPMDHIQGLSEGGELATVVWLSMLHLGFIEKF